MNRPTVVFNKYVSEFFLLHIGGSETKLLESLMNRTIPLWWDDLDNLLVLEKLTVLLYNKVYTVYICLMQLE